MDTRQDKQRDKKARQIAQPADGSLKLHGDQLEKPLHEMLDSDGEANGGSESVKPAEGRQGRQK